MTHGFAFKIYVLKIFYYYNDLDRDVLHQVEFMHFISTVATLQHF